MITIKKILAISAVVAVCTFAVSAPYVRAESENGNESEGRTTTVSSSHERESESEKNHVKMKIKKSKKKAKKHVVATKKTTTGSTSPATPTPSPVSTASYSMAQVAVANSKAKCWTAIGGKVYDLTPWIAQHPGGQSAILGICGKDGTAAFSAQHGGQSRPEQELKNFLIGTLK